MTVIHSCNNALSRIIRLLMIYFRYSESKNSYTCIINIFPSNAISQTKSYFPEYLTFDTGCNIDNTDEKKKKICHILNQTTQFTEGYPWNISSY